MKQKFLELIRNSRDTEQWSEYGKAIDNLLINNLWGKLYYNQIAVHYYWLW